MSSGFYFIRAEFKVRIKTGTTNNVEFVRRYAYWNGKKFDDDFKKSFKFKQKIEAESIAKELRKKVKEGVSLYVVMDNPKNKVEMKSKHIRLKPKTRTSKKKTVKKNPYNKEVEKIKKIYRDFVGENADRVVKKVRDSKGSVGALVGKIDEIAYTARIDGKVERLVHEFKKSSRPDMVVMANKKVKIVGGRYRFTDRGFVDY